MGALPLAMARLGAQVTLSENYGYYEGAFDELRDYLAAEGVEIWNLDLSEPLESVPEERFDLVAAMAILEHLPVLAPAAAAQREGLARGERSARRRRAEHRVLAESSRPDARHQPAAPDGRRVSR